MVSKIRSTARGFSFPSWSIPFALLALTILSFGLRASSLGFFWDDWPYLWFFHRFGADGILRAFEGDRPFLSLIYTLCLTLFGASTLAWQMFALAARWLCSFGFWWALAQAWPEQKSKAAWAAFLFAVYPGFSQQWIAVIYGQVFFLFAAQFFSIGLMLWLARRRQSLARGWRAGGTLLAMALSIFTMFSTEYFFGLELLRPVLLWLVFYEACAGLPPAPQPRQRDLLKPLRPVMAWWAPYLALMLAFVVWRGWIHPFEGHDLTTLQVLEQSPFIALRDLSITIVKDVLVSSLAAWGQPLEALSAFMQASLGAVVRTLGVILLTAALSLGYLVRLNAHPGRKNESPLTPPPDWGLQAIGVGGLAMLASGWPFWITGLKMQMGFPLDRYSLPLAVGVSLIFAGLVDRLGRRAGEPGEILRKAALLSVAVGLATGYHFNQALSYRQDWNTVSDFFWQLTWRAPRVAPGTLWVSDQMPFRYFEDDSLTAVLNWTYDPQGQSTQMPYMLYDLLTRNRSMPAYRPGQPIVKDFRATQFTGSTSQVLVVSYGTTGCVHLLDPRYDAELYRLPDRLQRALPLSKPGALVADSAAPATPPAAIFGSEPKRRWCYYYEKAELARQMGDWDAILHLRKQSIGVGYRPEDPAEYLPFIEAFAQKGYWDDAIQMTSGAYQEGPALRPALCALWQRSLQAGGAVLPADRQEKIHTLLSCDLP